MPEETQPQETDNPSTNDADDQADTLPENAVAVAEAGPLRKKVTVTVTRERIEAKLDEMFGELSSSAQVPGFRIGRAPRRLIERRFGREVSQDVRNALVGEAITPAIQKADLKMLGEPDIDLDKIELPEKGGMSFSFEVEVAPEFDLPELKGIKVARTVVEVNDQLIDAQLAQWRQSQARHEAADGPAADGDSVTAEVRITGPDIHELHRKDLTLRVAAGQVEGLPLVDLGEALSGKKAGESATLTVKVPDAHPNEDWRGKELSVQIAITQVMRRVMPEIDEEFAAKGGFESLVDLRSYVAKNLESRVAAETLQQTRKQVSDYLLANTEFDLPAGAAARHTAVALQRRYVQLLQMGVTREKIDENLTGLQAAATEQAQRELKLSFVLGEIADLEKIEVSEDEVNSAIAAMAQQYNRRPERMREELTRDGTLSQVEVSLREDKAIDKLLERAEITEAAPEPEEKKPAAGSKAKAKPKPKPKPKAKASPKPKAAKASAAGTKKKTPARKSGGPKK